MLNTSSQFGSVGEPTATAADRLFRLKGLENVDFHIRLENRTDQGRHFTHLHLYASTKEGTLSDVAQLPLVDNCATFLNEMFDHPSPQFLRRILEPFLARVARRINSGPIEALTPN